MKKEVLFMKNFRIKNKFALILSIFMVLMLCMGAVSASDNGGGIEESVLTSNYADVDNILNDAVEEQKVSCGYSEVLSDNSTGTFTDLNSLIENASVNETIILDTDYEGTFSHTITIGKSLTIEGNGHTIDCTNFSYNVFTISGSNVVLNNIRFKCGYGIYWSGVNGTLSNSYISGGSADYGGAVYWSGVNGTIVNCEFTDNNALMGGAVYWSGVNGTVMNSIFTNNNADLSGAIFETSPLSKSGNVFNNNTISDPFVSLIVGSLENASNIIDIPEDMTINNMAYINYPNVVINGNGHTIYANETSVFNVLYNNVTINNLTITNGNSDDNAGAIYWNGDDGYVNECNFINCSAYQDGGAIYWNGNRGIVNNSLFENNTAHAGSAIYWNGLNGSVIRSTFRKNIANSTGPLFAINDLSGNENNIFEDNENLNKFAEWFYDQIDNGFTVINLTEDIDSTGWFYIYKPVTVNGNNHTINANGNRVFSVISDNVTIKDLTIKNAHIEGGAGTAIMWKGNNAKLLNATFINCSGNNTLDVHRGTVFLQGDNSTVSDCKFINITGSTANSILLTGNNGVIKNTLFENCTTNLANPSPDHRYGALQLTGNNITVDNCTFVKNAIEGGGQYGGSMFIAGVNNSIINSNFYDVKAHYGGVIYLRGSNYTLENNTFENCYASFFGGALAVESKDTLIKNVTFINCTTGGEGGAISAEGSSSNVTIEDCSFTNCSANRGGAISSHRTYNTDYKIINSNFTECVANYGGAVDCRFHNSSISGSLFENCSSSYGGAINVVGNNVNISDSDFNNNSAKLGPAIYWAGDNGTVSDVKLTNNTASQHPDAIYGEVSFNKINITEENNNCSNPFAVWIYEQLEITNTVNLTKNWNSTDMVVINKDNITLNGNEFIVNYNNTRAFRIISNNVTFQNFTITNTSGDTVDLSGDEGVLNNIIFINAAHAISVNAVNCSISDCVFENCRIQQHNAFGGAISVNKANCTIIRCNFTNCSAYRPNSHTNYILKGGAIGVSGVNCIISDCNFDKCYAYSIQPQGGAIYVNMKDTLIINCNFTDCYVQQGYHPNYNSRTLGGAIYVANANCNITLCNFTNCKSTNYDAGAVYVSGVNCSIGDSTFDACTASNNGGAVYVSGVNCSIGDSTFDACKASNNGGAVYVNNVECTVDSCNFTYNTAKEFNTVNYCSDLVLTNSIIKDSYIQLNSYLVKNLTLPLKIGSFENMTLKFYIDDEYYGNISIEANTTETDYSIGNILLNQEFTINISSEPNESNNTYVIDAKTFKYVDRIVYYVSPDGDGDGERITTPTTFANALAKAEAGCKIVLLNGTYDNITGANINIDDLEIVGNNSTITSGGTTIFTISGNNITVDNITFNTTAHTITVNGGNCSISNCVFENNRIQQHNAFGGAISVNKADCTIDHCNFTNCNAYRPNSHTNYVVKGGAIGVSGVNCSISDCNFDKCYVYSIQPQGGAIYVNTRDTSIINCNFTDCYVQQGYHPNYNSRTLGGAIYVANANCNIALCNFTNCKSTNYDGGAIYVGGANCSIEGSSFNACGASNKGGAIYAGNVSNVTIQHNAFIPQINSGDKYNGIYIVNDETNFAYNWYSNNTPILSNIQNIISTFLELKADKVYDTLVSGEWNGVLDVYFVKNGTDERVDLPIRPVSYNVISDNADAKGQFTDTYGKLYPLDFTQVSATVKVDNQELGPFTFNVTDNHGFTELQDLIKGTKTNETVIVNNNYTFTPDNDTDLINGVTVDKGIIIALNGSSINGNNSTKNIFNITANDVVLENITIKDTDGTGITSTANNTKINNLNAENINGNIVDIKGDNASINNILAVGGEGYVVNIVGDYPGVRNISASNRKGDLLLIDGKGSPDSLNIVIDNVTYLNYPQVNVTASVDGNYTISIENNTYDVSVLDGKGTIIIPDVFDAKEYNATIKSTMSTYIVETTTTFVVGNATIDELTISVDNVTYPEQPVAVVNASVDGIYIVTVNNKNYTVNVINGTGSQTLDVLFADNYNVTAVSNIYNYDIISNTTSFTVKGIDTNVTVDIPEIVENKTTEIPINLPSGAEGNVSIMVNGETVDTKELVNGSAILELPELEHGQYNITVDYTGDGIYEKFTQNFNTTVKVDSEFNVTEPKVYENQTTEILVELPEDATGNVSVIVDGEIIDTQELVNGSAILEIPALSKENHTISVTYTGDDKYASQNLEFNVSVLDDVIITANDLVKYYSAPDKFEVNITDSKGNPLTNKSVSISLNGVTYNRTTNENGSVFLNIRLRPGEYEAVVNTDNVTLNKNITVLSTINGTDIVKIFRNGTQYYVTIKGADGSYLPEGSKVEFNINGVLYNRTVKGDEGLVKLNINLDEGEYIITATNLETNDSVSNTITVLSRIVSEDITKYFRNDTQYEVTLLDENGNPVGAGVSVTFNVNGIFYTRYTNDNGVAKLNINLPPGDWIVTANYTDCLASNNIKVLPVLTADNLVKQQGTDTPFVATLLNGQGQPYENQKVTFNINGVFNESTTDANGQAKLAVNLPNGKYIVTSSYNGCSISNNLTITN